MSDEDEYDAFRDKVVNDPLWAADEIDRLRAESRILQERHEQSTKETRLMAAVLKQTIRDSAAENAELRRVMQLETLADVQLGLLRAALVKWKRAVCRAKLWTGGLTGLERVCVTAATAADELVALVPADEWRQP